MLRLPYAEAVDIEGAAVGASLRVSPAGALVVSVEVAFARDDFARDGAVFAGVALVAAAFERAVFVLAVFVVVFAVVFVGEEAFVVFVPDFAAIVFVAVAFVVVDFVVVDFEAAFVVFAADFLVVAVAASEVFEVVFAATERLVPRFVVLLDAAALCSLALTASSVASAEVSRTPSLFADIALLLSAFSLAATSCA